MKKVYFIAFMLLSVIAYAQQTVKTKLTAKYSYSQKFGLSETETNSFMTVVFDTKKLKYKTHKGQVFTNLIVVKKTKKYVVCKNQEGNYSFYDIKHKQLYYIDYYRKRYLVGGFGSDNTSIKANLNKMMTMFNKGETQKDVVQFLIKQSEYDF